MFFERSVLKEIRILRYLHNNSAVPISNYTLSFRDFYSIFLYNSNFLKLKTSFEGRFLHNPLFVPCVFLHRTLHLNCYSVFIYVNVSVIGLVAIFRCRMLSALFIELFLYFLAEVIRFLMGTLNMMDVSKKNLSEIRKETIEP